MSLKVDYLIVGSGLTGATIARQLADAERDVVVLERREHLGGNVYDEEFLNTGIRYHVYGPHYFRTNSDRIWDFVNRFAKWYPFEASLRSWVDGQFEHWPVTEEYILNSIGENWREGLQGLPSANFEEECLAKMPRLIYEKFVKGYTEKQWGVDCKSLSPSLAGRFSVVRDNDYRLKFSKYQGLPYGGYGEFMQKMLEGISLYHNDYLANRTDYYFNKLIFTGPIDEFYGFKLGKLRYRCQGRTTFGIATNERLQPTIQLNFPGHEVNYIRRIEWNHLQEPGFKDNRVSLVTMETPCDPPNPNHYEYPFPDAKNQELYQAYKRMADADEKLIMAGRLGQYKYFDMDQAIGAALKISDALLSKEN